MGHSQQWLMRWRKGWSESDSIKSWTSFEWSNRCQRVPLFNSSDVQKPQANLSSSRQFIDIEMYGLPAPYKTFLAKQMVGFVGTCWTPPRVPQSKPRPPCHTWASHAVPKPQTLGRSLGTPNGKKEGGAILRKMAGPGNRPLLSVAFVNLREVLSS